MHIKNKTGQSTVEYVLLITAVLVVIIAFVATKDNGFQKQLNSTLGNATGEIGTVTDHLTNSHTTSGGGTGTPPYTVSVCPPGAVCK